MDPLTEAFANVARTLAAEGSVEATLQRLVHLAVSTITGCDHAAVTVVSGKTFETAAATDDVPHQVDAIQYETGEGPGLDAIRQHDLFSTDDLAEERRWPNFARRAAAATGVRSMISYRLFIEESTMGALNLYSRQRGAFDAEDKAEGSIFAAHAAVALAAAYQKEHLQEALASRDVIGQAKGILMAQQNVDADQAFDILRRASQRLNMKLRDLARQVTEGSATPEEYPNHVG
jgi:transcriptional regulator with GAF, ATPase, and Fis domain